MVLKKHKLVPLAFVLPGLLGGCDRSAPADQNSSSGTSPAPQGSSSAAPPNGAHLPESSQGAGGAPKAPASGGEKRPSGPLNVLFLTVDALRADMPWTTYEKPIAPRLTELAKQSVVYENHRSTTSYTAQTVATLLSGRFASTLYRTGTFFTNYFESNEWITEAMQKQGVSTMAVHAHLYFDRAPGLRQGFDVWKMVPGLSWNAQTDESITSDKSADAIISLLKDPSRAKEPFFLWSHLMDPHDKYVTHEESPDFGKNNRGRYDSEVWFTDFHIGKILDALEAQPYAPRTVVIISADHGEAFGDHGMHKHAFEIWDVLTRVPLLIRAPAAQPKRIAEPRTHIDIAPTLTDFLGVPALQGFQGKSLVPEVYGEKPQSREPIILELAEDTNNPARRAIVRGHHKLIVFDRGARRSLFDLKSDPGEEKDLSSTLPDKVKELETELNAYFEQLKVVEPSGGSKLKSGRVASGPKGP